MVDGFASTIFATPLAQTVLLFVLVFTVVFAVLQKSKILGDGKKQIDALVALAIGLLVTAVGWATDIISRLIPFLVVALIIILVFLLLASMFFVNSGFELPSGVRIAGGILAFIAVVIAVIYITGFWDTVTTFFTGSGNLAGNIVLIVIVGLAVMFALLPWKGDNENKGGGGSK